MRKQEARGNCDTSSIMTSSIVFYDDFVDACGSWYISFFYRPTDSRFLFFCPVLSFLFVLVLPASTLESSSIRERERERESYVVCKS